MDSDMKIHLFANGNVMVFDEEGEQMPHLQCSYLRMFAGFLLDKGYDIEDMEFTMPDGKIVIAEKTGPDWMFMPKDA
jgi:hypothetical protein